MDNAKIINHINQYFHNQGVKQENRLDLLITLIQSASSDNEIVKMLRALDYNNKDLIQAIFMLIGSKLTKFDLDQFYTPLTISEFICGMMTVDRVAIDPAGGTGDLLVYYRGSKTIWDIDENALRLCKLNYELNRQANYAMVCKNSLADFDSGIGQYDYVAMNPPFGSSTIVTDANILSKFELGTNRTKQEIGILFIELGLKLLKHGGRMFVIVPSGYVGNSNKTCVELRELLLKHRVVASIELPKNTFKRSGTGVNTYLLIIEKIEPTTTPYKILISSVENIGYNLSKKDTPPKYKVVPETGAIVYNNGIPVLDNDLVLNYDGEHVMSNELDSTILDIKRYTQKYRSTIARLTSTKAVPVSKCAKLLKSSTKIVSTQKYKYIDIGEINSPMYSYKEMYGWELPSRAKYTLKKYDILVSKLEGTMSYCVILDDCDNYISTNGVAVIRPNTMDDLYVLFGNVIKSDFKTQHTAFLTGSIMASLSDDDISAILVDPCVDVDATKKIIDTLEMLRTL
jgi:predicted RNA methylase